jgi:hypothetical protein
MRSIFTPTVCKHPSSGLSQPPNLETAVVLLIGIALASTFWMVTVPVAQAHDVTPREMIESKLPKEKNLMTAAKPELLSAVCAAVRTWPHASPQIVKTAVEAHKRFSGDIVGTALRCSREDKGVDCGLISEILVAALAVDPDEAAAILDIAFGLVPDCRDAIGEIGHNGPRSPGAGPGPGNEGNFTDPPVNQNPPPGSIAPGGGGGFDPQVTKCLVCHNIYNPHEIEIPCSQVEQYLQNHPGDDLGPCQVTPVQNK